MITQQYLISKKKLGQDFLVGKFRAHHYLQQHSDISDQLISSIYQANQIHEQCALVALGGYGRAELYPLSDIDLLILFQNNQDIVENRVSGFLHKLWDLGIKVGHSLRTIPECRTLAKNDITVQTALIESRLIVGSNKVFDQLIQMIAKDLKLEKFIHAKLLEQNQRHHRFHYADSPLEPNIKESPGGLRELHLLGFINRAMLIKDSNQKPEADVRSFIKYWQDKNWIDQEELNELINNRNFLQELRIYLHLNSYRANDILFFDYQKKIADAMGFDKNKNIEDQSLQSNELLMKNYYRVAMRNLQLCRILIENIEQLLFSKYKSSNPKKLNKLNFGLAIYNHNFIDVIDPDSFSNSPEHILKPYLWKYRGLAFDISAKLRRLINKTCWYLDNFRDHPTLKADFIQLLQLSNGVITTLRELNRMGFLGSYIKSFGKIVGQMQFDLYHTYTVDQHTLMVIRNLRRLMLPEFNHEHPEHSVMMSRFPKPWLLIIAALFHDIAKGRGGSHSILGMNDADEFCQQHNLLPKDRELVVWLVKEHLLMSKTSQTTDLSDPNIIAKFCQNVGNIYRLDALYLLTVADIRGTSPVVWTPWKNKLLTTLYREAADYIENKIQDSKKVKQINVEDAIKTALLKKGWNHKVVTKLITSLHDEYLASFEIEEIIWHLTYTEKNKNNQNKMAIRQLPKVITNINEHNKYLQLFLIDSDNDQSLFGRICGHLSHMYYSVMKAQNVFWQRNFKIIHFQIEVSDFDKKTSPIQINSLKQELLARLENAASPPAINTRIPRHLRHSQFKPQVRIMPDIKAGRYIITISAIDRLGILYNLILYFNTFKANIIHARINTLGERAENSFVIEYPSLKKTNILVKFEQGLQELLDIKINCL